MSEKKDLFGTPFQKNHLASPINTTFDNSLGVISKSATLPRSMTTSHIKADIAIPLYFEKIGLSKQFWPILNYL